ncbi:hypothetical protein [Nocardioides daphniae]|uniref:Uncharacterized protein n=1 Tax=Nocardioides daphniae TaxID=402297 RepID=A0A4P7UAG1_9ACTN|nr:hypothetical protein [Nocardioides daphniae]QCC76644.1 hypothetical protein E2C04_04430 [Nocardioides daphniae]GGD15011.1 hypothetical protein GCM10007231_12450 [Nocardioides daphniae]
MKVTDPHGRVWRVSRRWVPWRRRGELSDHGELPSLLDGDADDPIGCAVWLVGLVITLPLVVLTLAALAFSLVELLLLAVLLPFAVLARVAFGRRWHVEVRHGFERVWEAEAGTWSDSRVAIAAQGEHLRRGEHPAQAMVAVPTPRVKRSDRVPGGKRARRKEPDGGSTDA